MKRLFLILSVFLTSLPAVADSIATVAPLDSVAYAIGYKYTATIQADETGPVPIPNTEVKLICADNTCRVTCREDR